MKLRIVMDEGIGNMVMLTPTIRAIKDCLPDASITVMGKPVPLKVIDGWELVDKCISTPDDDRYDITFMSIWSKNFGQQFGDQLQSTSDKMLAIDYNNLDIHEADHQLRIARYLGYNGSLPDPFCMTREIEVVLTSDQPIVCLSDTCLNLPEWQRKRWPYYKLLAEQLIREGYYVILTGGEDEDIEYNAPDWSEGVLNCMGRYDIPGTAALIKKCNHFIGNDSGPAHIAAAVGTDTTVIFGPTRTAKNRPLGRRVKVIQKHLDCVPCQYTTRWDNCDNHVCMGMVSVKDVISAMRNGYNAPAYWRDRLGKYGLDLRGVGHAGKSHDENEREYAVAIQTLRQTLESENVDVKTARILDIGCGAGVYTQALKNMGAEDYTGIDITDALFSELRRKFPDCKFNQVDITTQELVGDYDLILMLDVTQHITCEDAFKVAMANIKRHLRPDGTILVTSWLSESGKWNSYYEKLRPIELYQRAFDGYTIKKPIRFRDKWLLRIFHPDRAKSEAKISACLMVKNEEEHLEACLESVKDLVSEIVVVDTGSTDKTIAIAQQFDARIYHRPWDDDFSASRNYSFSLATGDWILYIDGDEILEVEDHELIRKIIAELDTRPEVDAVSFDILNHVKGKMSKHEFERLYRAGSTHFEGIKHNQPKYEGQKAASPVRIHHYGYDLSPERMKEKNEQSIRLSLKAVEADPNSAHLYQNLSKAYRAAHQWDNVIDCYTRFWKQIQNGNIQLYAQSDQMMAVDAIYSRMKKGEYVLAKDLAVDLVARYPNNLDAYFLLGDIYSKLVNSEKSVESYEHYLSILETMQHQAQRDNLIKDTWGCKPDAYNNMGAEYIKMNRLVDAIVCFGMANNLAPEDEVFKKNYANAVAELIERDKREVA